MKKAIFLMTLLAVSTLFVVLIISSSRAESNTVLIRIGDLYFKPNTIQLKAGQQVKIELVNDGNLEHEFMVGRGVTEEGKHEMHEGMYGAIERKQGSSEVEHEHNEGMSETKGKMSKSFEEDFFNGIDIEHYVMGGEFTRVPDHGTMVKLKPGGNAILYFKIPDNRKGDWQIACFVPGHYEADMKGLIIIN